MTEENVKANDRDGVKKTTNFKIYYYYRCDYYAVNKY